MNKLIFQLFCVSNLIIFHYATEYSEEIVNNRQAYNLKDLLTKSLNRLQSPLDLNDESRNPIFNLKFSGFDPVAEFQQLINLSQNSSKCLDDILFLLESFKNKWPLYVFDSFGKPESGALLGNLKWIGDYNECITIQAMYKNSTTERNFRGKYCSLTFSLPPASKMPMPLPIVMGICVPASCSATELQSVFEISHAGGVLALNDTKTALNASITCKPTERHLNTPAKAVIVLLSIFCTLAVVGSSITAVNYFKKIIKDSKRPSLTVNVSESQYTIGEGSNMPGNLFEKDYVSLIQDNISDNQTKGKLETFFSCFCMFTNGAKILNTDSSEGQLLCIHGIRFLSMSWVILGHTYSFSLSISRNLVESVRLVDNFPFQVVLQGFYSVDSFFVLSGFLLAYLSMKEFSKTEGVISWPYFYIHRYIRLTPIYMIVLGYSATLNYYIGSGPFWPDGDYDPICRDNWWRNLLYINNFSSMTKQCMAWSWYLANDMQFFVISPIFLITLWRWPKIGYSILAAFLCSCWLSNFFITYHFELVTGITDLIGKQNAGNMAETLAKFFDKIYIKPYTRIGPYLVGILVGYLLFKHNTSQKPKYSLIFIGTGWIIATTITLACVYGMYHSSPTVIGRSFFNALSRTCFAMGLSWVIYVCLIGQGGVVNGILSYKLFIPLSRLTYAAYLIHPMIVGGYYQSLKTTFAFSHPTVVFVYLGIMVVTYALSLPVALILESPIVSMEKLIRKALSRKEPS